MKKHRKVGAVVVLVVAILALASWYLHHQLIPVLQPAGEVGAKERNLIIFCASISVAIVVPVFGLMGYFAYKYREGNKKAKYTPELEGSRLAETIWWIVPTMLIGIIAVITWNSSYALDPYKPLASNKPVLHIQVIALDWKWLFIYPNQKVASVNEAAVPVGTPVEFELTSDTVMNSFWDPQLGGQMYAMPGMDTQLNLMANKIGSYRGVSANISGKGFAGMAFAIKAMPQTGYDSWLKNAQHANQALTPNSYAVLARPSEDNKPTYYASVSPGLYDTILLKYMMPMNQNEVGDMSRMTGMNL